MKKLLFIASLFVFQSILFSIEASRLSEEEDSPISSPRSPQPLTAKEEFSGLEQSGYFALEENDLESFLLSRRMVGERIRNEYAALKAIRSRAKADAQLAKGSQPPEIDELSEKLIGTTTELGKVIKKLKKLDKRNTSLGSRTASDGLVRSMREAQEIESELEKSIKKAHRIIEAQAELAKRANAEQVQYLRKELLRSQREQLEAFRQIKGLQAQMEGLQKECERLRSQSSEESGRASGVVVEDDSQVRGLPLAAFAVAATPTVEEPMTVRGFEGMERPRVPLLDTSRVLLVCQPEGTDATRDRLPSTSQAVVALRHNRPFALEDIYTERVARNLGLLGAEYIQPDSPIAMEMFFNFTEAKIRAELSSLLSEGRRLGGDSLDRVIRLELMLNERILLTLNGIDAAFSREDKINSIFRKTEGKGPEETAALSCILKGYRAFFCLRVDFLGQLLDSRMTPSSLPKFEFLTLDGSPDENNKLGKMTKYIENLVCLFNDVRNEFFEIKVPLDILSAQESIVVNFSKEHRRLMSLVGCPMNGSADALKAANYADPLRLESNFTRKVSSNIKGYMDPKTYLIELANALRKQTSLQTASSLSRFLDRQ